MHLSFVNNDPENCNTNFFNYPLCQLLGCSQIFRTKSDGVKKIFYYFVPSQSLAKFLENLTITLVYFIKFQNIIVNFSVKIKSISLPRLTIDALGRSNRTMSTLVILIAKFSTFTLNFSSLEKNNFQEVSLEYCDV